MTKSSPTFARAERGRARDLRHSDQAGTEADQEIEVKKLARELLAKLKKEKLLLDW